MHIRKRRLSTKQDINQGRKFRQGTTFSIWDRDLIFADSKRTHTGQDSCGYLDIQSPLHFKR